MFRQPPQIGIYNNIDTAIGNIDPTQLRSLTMTSEINGEHSLEIVTSQHLEKRQRLVLKRGRRWDYDPYTDPDPCYHEFVVQGVSTTHDADGEAVSTYYCVWSIQHDLEQTYIDDQYGCGVVPGHASIPHPAEDGLACALEGTSRWVIDKVTVTSEASASFYRRSGWEGLQTVVEKWGGEIDALIEIEYNRVSKRGVRLLSKVRSGNSTNRRFDYGSNVKRIRRVIHDQPWTCRIVPLGKAMETEAGGYTRRPTIASVNDGVVWLQDDDAVSSCRYFGTPNEYPIQIVKNDTYEEPADLKAWALEHIKDYTTPKVSYEATVVDLAQYGLNVDGLGLGDDVAIVDHNFAGETLRLQGRVVKLVEDLLDPSKTEITISNLSPSMGGIVSSINKQISDLSERVDSAYQQQDSDAYVSDLITRVNDNLNAVGGYTYLVDGVGIRSYDQSVTDPSTGSEATRAVEIANGYIRVATSKDGSGNWNWNTLT